MDILAKLFSSAALIKIMRLFLLHPEKEYDPDDISAEAKIPRKSVPYEVNLLTSIGFLKPRSFFKTVTRRRGRKKIEKRMRVRGWRLDPSFEYFSSIRSLLLNSELIESGDLRKRLRGVGKIKLIVTAGAFLQDPDGHIDLLIVGEGIDKQKLMSAVRSIETIVGAELRYASFSPQEFEYRLNVRDRLLRNIFDSPHILLENSLRLPIPTSMSEFTLS